MNRYLSTVRNLLRIARDEWQWIDVDSEDPHCCPAKSSAIAG